MALEELYYMLGQDAFKGAIDEAWLTEEKDESLDDTEPLIGIYDHDGATADNYDTTPAAMLSNTQSAGDKLIVALDCTMFRDLLVQHPIGLSVVKRTDMGALGGAVGGDRWLKAFSEHWDNIAAADTAVRAVITGAGNTVDPKGAFLCFGYEEAILGLTAVDAAFLGDLQQFIFELRDTYMTPAAPIVLDLPPKTVSGYSGSQLTSLKAARKGIFDAAFLDSNVSFINTDDLARTAGGVEYTGAATMVLGQRMAAEMKRLRLTKGAVAGGGIPVYILLGDEGAVGAVEDTFLDEEEGADFEDDITLALIWNWTNQTWESLNGQVTANTETDGLTKFGPDVAMMVKLLAIKHPGEEVAIFKLGKDNSSLGNPASTGGSWAKSDAVNYTTALDEWEVAKQALFDVVDKVPDVRAIIWYQAEEDVLTETLASAYAANLSTHITNLRLDFSTRTDLAEFPVPIILPLMIDTGKYDPDDVATIRQAQQAFVDADSRATLVDLDGAIVHSNQQNLSGGGIHTAGEAIADAAADY